MELRKVVVAPDSFKGSLSAADVVEACVMAFMIESPETEIIRLPLADGGEGTVDALSGYFGGERIMVEVAGPLGKKVKAHYLLDRKTGTALMEMAQAAGLVLLNKKERNPMLTSTYGVGEMIKDALDRGCRRIYMGIGGSATNDGGMGMLTALGCRFLDEKGKELRGCGGDLSKVTDICLSKLDSRLEETSFVIACDVDNPFYGTRGAAVVFAPQKGADKAMVESLDNGMWNYAEVISSKLGKDIAALSGAGAAGGLGGAFIAFLNARLRQGIEMILDAIGFDRKIVGADWVITGEGSVDRQTLMGKTLYGVLKRSTLQGIPVVVLAGNVRDSDELNEAGFRAVLPIESGVMALEEAMNRDCAMKNITRTCRQIIRLSKLE